MAIPDVADMPDPVDRHWVARLQEFSSPPCAIRKNPANLCCMDSAAYSGVAVVV